MMKVRMRTAMLCLATSLVSINAVATTISLPAVKAARAVAPEIRTMLLDEIFLSDRLGARGAFNPLQARLGKLLTASPKYAVYANQTLKFRHDKLFARHFHGKIVLFRLGNSYEIGVASKLALTNVKDEVMVNNFVVKTKDIEGVLVWDSPLYGKVAHPNNPLSESRLMYVIDDIAAQGELLGKEGAEGVYELKKFKLDTQALADAKPDEATISGEITSVFSDGEKIVVDDEGVNHFVQDQADSAAIDLLKLPDGHFVSGQTLAVFTNGAKLVVGEHYRNVDRTEWVAAKEGELLRVYLIK